MHLPLGSVTHWPVAPVDQLTDTGAYAATAPEFSATVIVATAIHQGSLSTLLVEMSRTMKARATVVVVAWVVEVVVREPGRVVVVAGGASVVVVTSAVVVVILMGWGEAVAPVVTGASGTVVAGTVAGVVNSDAGGGGAAARATTVLVSALVRRASAEGEKTNAAAANAVPRRPIRMPCAPTLPPRLPRRSLNGGSSSGHGAICFADGPLPTGPPSAAGPREIGPLVLLHRSDRDQPL